MPFMTSIGDEFKLCFGVAIPKKLIDGAEKIFKKSWQFLLERGYRGEQENDMWKIKNLKKLIKNNSKNFLIKLNEIIDEIEKLHKENWNKFSNERKMLIRHIKEMLKKYENNIIVDIEKLTKIPWGNRTINIYPVFDVKNRALGNCLLISFSPKTLNDEKIVGIIHEAVHANTFPTLIKHDTSSKNFMEAYEIATHIVASLVIKEINTKFSKNIPTKTECFDEKIRHELKTLEGFCVKSDNFMKFLFKVQQFLNEINYEKPFLKDQNFWEDYAQIFKGKYSY